MNQFTREPGEQESGPRNLKSHKEETIAALARVEGEEWMKQQREWTADNIAGALAWIEETEGVRNYIIYGQNGHNRWLVDRQGKVFLLKDSAYDESINLARQEGFQII